MTEPGHGDRPHPRERGVLIATVTASHLTRGTGLGQRFWAFPRDPTDPRSRCSTAKAQQKQQNIEHSPPPRQGKAWQDICSSTGGSPCAASLWNGTRLMDILRAGKGLVLVRCGRMGRKGSVNPPGGFWAGTWHFPPLHPVPFLLARPSLVSHGVSSTLQPCLQ